MGTPFQDLGGAGAFVGKRQVAGHYGNQNRPRCEEAKEDYAYVSSAVRLAYQTFSGLFPDTTTTSSVPLIFSGNVQWNQPIYSAKFSQTKQAQQTEYVFALTQVVFNNDLNNIYSGNNLFPFTETISGVSIQKNAVLATNVSGQSYLPSPAIGAVAFYLWAALNKASSYPGNGGGAVRGDGNYGIYFVGVSGVASASGGNGQYIYINQQNLSGQNIPISFSVGAPITQLSIPNYNALSLTGMDQSQYLSGTPSGSITITGSQFFNLWAGLDTLFITCDILRYPYVYQNQPLANNIYLSGVFPVQQPTSSAPVLAQIPFNVNSETQEVYQIMNLQWHETIGYPFEKNINWSLTDSNFYPVVGRGDFAIYLTIKMKPVGLEVLD